MKKLKLIFGSLFIISLGLISCQSTNENYQEDLSNSEFLHRSMKSLTDVIVYDIFSPPVASRIYAYPSIAAYEALQPSHPEYKTMAGQLSGLSPVPQPDPDLDYSPELASVHAFLTVGKAFVFSEAKLAESENAIYEEIKAIGVPSHIYKNSMDYGKMVADHILAWADKDNYKETRTFPKYSVDENEEAWKPTPPDYMDGIEPSWSKIRTFVIDSANQFVPLPPTEFSMDKESQFYKELIEVYEIGENLTEEQTEIAQFWDCNPYVSQHYGHVMFATKKITPGGHWIGIASIASRQSNLDFMATAEVYAKTSIALADAFISCWDEKWRSILVRPETLINKFIDDDWAPLLQTPPFPEYTSGHSVISAAAATVLTDLFGPEYHFSDTTENEFGLPTREFDSFQKASEEAAISRLYGGIHYLPACEIGIAQGREVGDFVVKNLSTRKEDQEES